MNLPNLAREYTNERHGGMPPMLAPCKGDEPSAEKQARWLSRERAALTLLEWLDRKGLLTDKEHPRP